jgi:hypothetical protein
MGAGVVAGGPVWVLGVGTGGAGGGAEGGDEGRVGVGVLMGAVDSEDGVLPDPASGVVVPGVVAAPRSASVSGWAQLAHHRASARLAVPHCGQRTGRSSVIALLYE